MKKTELYKKVLTWFAENNPGAETELHFNSPFQLLVAVMLSAQCTDKRVNTVTPALFKRFPDARSMAASDTTEIFEYIKSVSYPNSKAAHLYGTACMLVNDFGGQVPSTMEELTRLPGVGRKTANVVLSVEFNQPTMAVDTHVFRVSDRIGLTTGSKTPLETEKQLMKHIPLELVPKAHHWLILHGRYICTARNPKCDGCGLNEWCRHKSRTDSSPLKTTSAASCNKK